MSCHVMSCHRIASHPITFGFSFLFVSRFFDLVLLFAFSLSLISLLALFLNFYFFFCFFLLFSSSSLFAVLSLTSSDLPSCDYICTTFLFDYYVITISSLRHHYVTTISPLFHLTWLDSFFFFQSHHITSLDLTPLDTTSYSIARRVRSYFIFLYPFYAVSSLFRFFLLSSFFFSSFFLFF
jgi:hypothetical protein